MVSPSEAFPLEPSDHELVVRAQSDASAFGLLYDRHYQRILNYSYRCTLSIQLAEDVTSTVFLCALRKLACCRQGQDFVHWLYRIATNEIKMHWRRERSRCSVEEQYSVDAHRIYIQGLQQLSPAVIAGQMEEFAHMRDSLACLPQKYRQAIAMRYFEGMPLEDIAAVLGKPLNTIKTWVRRGLAKMESRMKNPCTFLPLAASDRWLEKK